MDESWTLPQLVEEAASHLARLPAPANGQVRAVPDERGLRYYAGLGLLDRPVAMRGRTALYGRRHLAQVVAIKRLQTAGKSLAEIQALWPTIDDATLASLSGVAAPRPTIARARAGFWREAPAAAPVADAATSSAPARPRATPGAALSLTLTLAPGITLAIAVPPDGRPLSAQDVQALHAAAAPLLTALAQLTSEEP